MVVRYLKGAFGQGIFMKSGVVVTLIRQDASILGGYVMKFEDMPQSSILGGYVSHMVVRVSNLSKK